MSQIWNMVGLVVVAIIFVAITIETEGYCLLVLLAPAAIVFLLWLIFKSGGGFCLVVILAIVAILYGLSQL